MDSFTASSVSLLTVITSYCILSALLLKPQVSYKKDAKANLHYTSVVDRPDIKKATQAAKLISEVMIQYSYRMWW